MTVKNDKAWIGDLLGGPLMSRESRIIAELMLTNPDEQNWQEQIVGYNLLAKKQTMIVVGEGAGCHEKRQFVRG